MSSSRKNVAHRLKMKLSNSVVQRAEKSLKMMVFERLRAGGARVFFCSSLGSENITTTESDMNLMGVLTKQIDQNGIHP